MQAIHNRGSRVSQITLLERSLRSTERMDSANELTVNIGPFLSQVLKAIVQWLLAVANVPEADVSFALNRKENLD